MTTSNNEDKFIILNAFYRHVEHLKIMSLIEITPVFYMVNAYFYNMLEYVVFTITCYFYFYKNI